MPDDLQHVKYAEGVSCSYCYDSLDDEKRESSRQRHRQIQLAESRNEKHLGYQEEKYVKAKKGVEVAMMISPTTNQKDDNEVPSFQS